MTTSAVIPLLDANLASPPTASALVAVGLPVLAVAVVLSFVLATWRAAGGRAALVLLFAAAGWLGLTGLLAARGVWADFAHRPPPLAALLVGSLGLPLLLAFSPWGRALSRLPVLFLVGSQAFRLPLELCMHEAARQGIMPPQMTFTGDNFDIVSGATALFLALAATRVSLSRGVLLAWNVLGTALLAVILVVALASLPAFAAFGRAPAHLNTWVAFFPYVWLPAGLVSSAVLGHALLWRRLLGSER